MNHKTTYESMCNILGDFWIEYKGDTQFEDFMQYNDLGLPLAYAISSNLVQSSKRAQMFVEETFELLLAALDLEDEGFDSLDDLIILGGGFDQ